MRKLFSFITALGLGLMAQAQTAPSLQWQKSLGGSADDEGTSIRQTTDDGYIMAGAIKSTNGDVVGYHGGLYDGWVVKLDGDGTLQWQRALGGPGVDGADCAQQTSDGGYIIAGTSGSVGGDVTNNHGDYDGWIVKLDASGVIQWQQSLGGSESDYIHSIQQTSDSGYIAVGGSRSSDGDVTINYGSYDVWVVKLNSTGAMQWQKSLGGSGDDEGYSIEQTNDGGYIAAGLTTSTDGDVTGINGGVDGWVVKLDGSGALEWQRALGGSGNETLESMQQTEDGGYIVAGTANSNDGDISGFHGSMDYWVVKLDPMGTIQWQKCLGGSDQEWGQAIEQLGDGGYIVTGWTESDDGQVTGFHGGWDTWVVRLNEDGDLLWQKALGGSADELAFSVDQCSDNGYILAGWSNSTDGDVTGNHGGSDCWVVRLTTDPAGIPELQDPAQFSLYPNPSTSAVNIELDLKAAAPVRLQLYDTTGKLVATVLDEKASTGKHSIHYSTAGLPAGLYELRLTAGGGTMTRRLVKE